MWRPAFGVLAAVAALAVAGSGAWSMISDAYPTDFVKREALARCTANDTRFVRFSSQDRDNCYAGLHVPGYAHPDALIQTDETRAFRP